MFYKGLMKPLKSKPKIRKFYGFDVETYGKEKKFVSGGFTDGKTWFYTEDKTVLAKEMLRSKYRNCCFVATNLSFDFISTYFDTSLWSAFENITMRGSDILFSVYKHENREETLFIDTINFAPFSVERLGDIIGLKKLRPPTWFCDEKGNAGYRKPKNTKERLELEAYNKRDCEITFHYMNDLYQPTINELGGSVRVTGASTALHLYRSAYQQRPIRKESIVLGRDIKKFIFEGYYGGRTEVFTRGKFENAYYYDVNSLYPYSMKNEFPLPQSVQDVDQPSRMNIYRYHGVSRVRITCPYIDYPFLPVRTKNKLIFPYGTFEGVYNHHELRKAVEVGYRIHEVQEQIIYTQTFRPFDTWVDDLYTKRLALKKEGSPQEVVVKSILNSLYGKFGQKAVKDTIIRDESEVTEELLTKCDSYRWGDGRVVFETEKDNDPVFSFPILSSYITGYARILMYDYITDLQALYTDTDSIITFHKIEHSKELGRMKLEKTITEGVIIRPKLYRGDDHIRSKGFRRLNREGFDAILRGEEIKIIRFAKLKESLRRGLTPMQDIEVPKKASLEDDKRVWNEPFNPLVTQYSKPLEIHHE